MKLTKMGALFILTSAIFISCAPQECQYDQWDSNEDTFLNTGEFGVAYNEVGYFNDWDDDDDDSLSELEWEQGIDEHLEAYDSGKLSDWDTNGDGMISERELQDGLFDLVDHDDDGAIGDDDWVLFSQTNGLFCDENQP